MGSKAKDYLKLMNHHMYGECPTNSTVKMFKGESRVITYNKFFVKDNVEEKALIRAFRYLFEGNAVHYIKRIVRGQKPEGYISGPDMMMM